MPYIGAGIQRFNTADGLTVNGTAEVTGASTLTGAVTADAGVSIDNITIDGTEIDLSSGNLTLDVAGDINLDADGGDVNFKDGGTSIGYLSNSSGTLLLGVNTSDADFKVQGNDGGSTINALTIDMSEAGAATFNAGVTVANSIQFGSDAQTKVAGAGSSDVDLLVSGDTNIRFETGTNERMRIDNSGNVGIGTTSPNVELEIAGAGEMLRLQSSDTNKASIRAIQSGGGDRWILGTLDSNDSVTLQASNSTGELIFETGGATERARISSGGRMSIGTTSTSFRFNVVSDQSDYVAQFDRNVDIDGNFRNHIKFSRGGTAVGEIKTSQSATQYGTSSDHRLKENVEGMTGAIARVKQLSPKRFSWIVDELDSPNFDGFLAHEAQTVVPQAVSGTHNAVDDDGKAVMQGIDHSHLVPLLTGALQEAITKIETLETEMTALKARVTALEDG